MPMQGKLPLYKHPITWALMTILGVVSSFLYLYKLNNLSIEATTNLSDIYSNIISVTILLLTLLVLNKINEQGNRLDKSVTFEKGLLLSRVSMITAKSEELYDIIEAGKVKYQPLKRHLDSIERSCRLVNDLIKDEKSLLNGDKGELLTCNAAVEDHLDKCMSILTETTIREATSIQRDTYITINDDEIIIHEQGIAAARLQVNDIIKYSIKLSLLINRAD